MQLIGTLKPTVMLLLCALSLAVQSAAMDSATLDKAAQLRDQALTSDQAYKLLESLTTEVGPRLAGSDKELEAIEWAKTKFREMGFDKVWTEPVKVKQWQRLSESAAVIAPFTQPLQISTLGHSVSTPPGGATGEIAHFATLEALEKASPGEVKDKIVFISNRMHRHKTGSGYGPAVRARGEGASIAGAMGAKALLIRSIGTDSHRLPHTGVLRYDEDKPKIAAAALSNPDADLLERMLERGNPVSLTVNIQTRDKGEVEVANVIGEIQGRTKPDEVVLLGAHLDSWDLGTGAVDDGAGVALTMAAANLIQDSLKQRPYRTIRVVLFAAEEVGLVGAKAYAAAHQDDMDKHIIGAESDFGAGPVWALSAKVGAQALPVIDSMAQLMGALGVVRSDSIASGGPDVGQMVKLGMPAVDLMQDGTDYFDLHHTADDTLDKVDPKALQQNLAAWTVFAYLAAQWPGSFR
ncbi:M20/M25/M40 family metallo-hydrolase [Bowmanella dokdonensis]|uniref:Carboxypeptidase Q n=1 Tax=Bowmanella dokdonensis TaxID=751969 RepID=A0A939DPW1_9ALTE|nr:M20/M25/M40 family metallo-hydrolase [Bowmanella dokdonensis]MBN7826774.1 M20/M25/M40 family metallo-hydrolase [Bowmanella dokdonensis]